MDHPELSPVLNKGMTSEVSQHTNLTNDDRPNEDTKTNASLQLSINDGFYRVGTCPMGLSQPGGYSSDEPQIKQEPLMVDDANLYEECGASSTIAPGSMDTTTPSAITFHPSGTTPFNPHMGQALTSLTDWRIPYAGPTVALSDMNYQNTRQSSPWTGLSNVSQGLVWPVSDFQYTGQKRPWIDAFNQYPVQGYPATDRDHLPQPVEAIKSEPSDQSASPNFASVENAVAVPLTIVPVELPKPDPVHRCHICELLFPSLSELIRHLSLHEAENQKEMPSWSTPEIQNSAHTDPAVTRNCAMGDNSDQNINELRIPLDSDLTDMFETILVETESQGKYRCKFCKYDCITLSEVRRHVGIKRQGRFKCTLCSQTFCRYGHLTYHRYKKCDGVMLTTDDGSQKSLQHDIYRCSACSKIYLTRNALRRHNLDGKCPGSATAEDGTQLNDVGEGIADSLVLQGVTDNVSLDMECEAEPATFSAAAADGVDQVDVGRSSKERPYECQVCNKLFLHELELEEHMNIFNDPSGYKCISCHVAFTTAVTLRRHLNGHENKKRFQCPACGKRWARRDKMMIHFKSSACAREGRTAMCDHCGGTYLPRQEFPLHEHGQCTKQMSPCASCGRLIGEKDQLDERERCQQCILGKSPCQLCGLIFEDDLGLAQHNTECHLSVETKSEEGDSRLSVMGASDSIDMSAFMDMPIPTLTPESMDHFCLFCQIMFSTEEEYISHKVTCIRQPLSQILAEEQLKQAVKPVPSEPTGDFQCASCDRLFRSLHSLKKHKLESEKKPCVRQTRTQPVSPAERPPLCDVTFYECHICCKMFLSFSELEEHIQQLKDSQEPHCSVCHIQFTTKSTLKRHILNNHLNLMGVYCPGCCKEYSRKARLKIHLKKCCAGHIENGKSICSICRQRFDPDVDLDVHLKCGMKEDAYPCWACGQLYITRIDLLRHKSSCNQEHSSTTKTQSCTFAGPGDEDSNSAHSPSTTEDPTGFEELEISPSDPSSPKFEQMDTTGEDNEVTNPARIATKRPLVLYGISVYTHMPGGVYRCSTCNHTFKSHTEYQHHITKYQGDDTRRCVGKGLLGEVMVCKGYRYKTLTDTSAAEHVQDASVHEDNAVCTSGVFEFENSSSSGPAGSLQLNADTVATSDEDNLDVHKLEAASDDQPSICDGCGRRYESEAALQTHLQTIKDKKELCCLECHVLFSGSAAHKRHMKAHISNERYLCPVCKRAFKRTEQLSRHMQRRCALSEESLLCCVCMREYIPRDDYSKHLPCIMDSRMFVCQACGEAYRTAQQFAKHRIICERRGERDSIEDTPEAHKLEAADGGKPSICDGCSRRFQNEAALQAHLQVLEDKKELCCLECHVLFTNSTTHKRHMNAHVSNKRYPCPVCKHAFKRKDQLSRHMKIRCALSEESILCSVCGKQYIPRDDYSKHLPCITDTSMFICRGCGDAFWTVQLFEKHRIICEHNVPPNTTDSGDVVSATGTLVEGGMTDEGKSTRNTKATGVETSDCVTGASQDDATCGMKCPFEGCIGIYANNSKLQKHINRIHRRRAERKCPHCPKVCKSSAGFKTHLLRHKEPKAFQCRFCPYKCHLKIQLEMHEPSHLTEKPHVCAVCTKSFKSKFSLNTHYRVHQGYLAFECDICHKKFRKLKELRYHKNLHNKVNAPSFCCENCGAEFFKSHELHRHQVNVHGAEKKFACSLCPKKFIQKTLLNYHLLRHMNQKRYPCPECDKTFMLMTELTEHRRVHSGETPFQCDLCQKKFHRKATYNQHLRTHGEKKHVCYICGAKFSELGYLNRHIKQKHD